MMPFTPDDDLTPDELARFASLPRTAPIDDLALERTVAALRERGLLHSPKRRHARRALVVVGSLAASLVLFASGVVFGQRLARPDTSRLSPAAQVQLAGSAYVAAVVRLGESSPSSVPADAIAGLQAGASTLRAAAATLARIDPGDAQVERLHTVLEFASNTSRNVTDAASGRLVVWF
jgi:hypothetical protein